MVGPKVFSWSEPVPQPVSHLSDVKTMENNTPIQIKYLMIGRNWLAAPVKLKPQRNGAYQYGD